MLVACFIDGRPVFTERLIINKDQRVAVARTSNGKVVLHVLEERVKEGSPLHFIVNHVPANPPVRPKLTAAKVNANGRVPVVRAVVTGPAGVGILQRGIKTSVAAPAQPRNGGTVLQSLLRQSSPTVSSATTVARNIPTTTATVPRTPVPGPFNNLTNSTNSVSSTKTIAKKNNSLLRSVLESNAKQNLTNEGIYEFVSVHSVGGIISFFLQLV